MLDHPVYVRIPTDNDTPHFASASAAEVVISTLMSAQRLGWLRLHGFVLLPDALEMVFTPIKQGISGAVAQIQAETIPLLAILLPNAGMLWGRRYAHMELVSQKALDARLGMLLLAPVANGLSETADSYPYSSANTRYASFVSVFAGFKPDAVPPADAPTEPTISEVEPSSVSQQLSA